MMYMKNAEITFVICTGVNKCSYLNKTKDMPFHCNVWIPIHILAWSVLLCIVRVVVFSGQVWQMVSFLTSLNGVGRWCRKGSEIMKTKHHSQVKAKVLLLLKKVVQDVLSNKVGV